MKLSTAFTIISIFNQSYAHVTANPSTAVEGTYFATVFRVPHGCGNSSTVQVTINYDEELINAKTSFTPENISGWKASKVLLPGSASGTPSESGDGSVTTGVIYSNGELPYDMYGDFGVSFKLPLISSLPSSRNGTLYFAINQLCKNGQWQNWTTPGDNKFPPPQIKLTASTTAVKSEAFSTALSLPLILVGSLVIFWY